MAWCFPDEATAYTEDFLNRLSTLSDSAIVPALWLYEIVNVVVLATRKGRITQPHATQFLESLTDLPIEVDYPSTHLILKLSRRSRNSTGSPDTMRPIWNWAFASV